MLHCYVIKLHIKESKTYTQINMHSDGVDLIPLKLLLPALKLSDLILLFCMTIRELLALAALELFLAGGSYLTFYLI